MKSFFEWVVTAAAPATKNIMDTMDFKATGKGATLEDSQVLKVGDLSLRAWSQSTFSESQGISVPPYVVR